MDRPPSRVICTACAAARPCAIATPRNSARAAIHAAEIAGVYELAPALQSCVDMGSDKRRVPQSYDEIVRRTVPDLDSSQRPTARQEQLAREGFRAMDERERALCARTVAALEDALASSNESWSFNLEVDRETVTLRGHVRDAATIALIEEIVRGVAGVEDVENRLVVGV